MSPDEDNRVYYEPPVPLSSLTARIPPSDAIAAASEEIFKRSYVGSGRQLFWMLGSYTHWASRLMLGPPGPPRQFKAEVFGLSITQLHQRWARMAAKKSSDNLSLNRRTP